MTVRPAATTAPSIEAAAAAPVLQGLPALASPHARLLVLGSFPSVASLAAQQYYGHPRNQFWPLLSALWGQDLRAMPYRERCDWVARRGLAVWDVYASCQREGSLDADIRAAAPNDLQALVSRLPQLRAIAHNGGESARSLRVTQALGLPVLRLPSTSPANASWSFERKLQAWREVFAFAGLLDEPQEEDEGSRRPHGRP
ncbi:DNA-deoxyinosine glycosylase [Mitsuaria sp. WAJ17]|nr:DNA-deoxyinosine glycosylase [Mitsuaria sp. WAJ17]MBB2484460.1 DNA-deoxyinosine glycosylase [Mitsuaria sp. WAJ17]